MTQNEPGPEMDVDARPVVEDHGLPTMDDEGGAEVMGAAPAGDDSDVVEEAGPAAGPAVMAGAGSTVMSEPAPTPEPTAGEGGGSDVYPDMEPRDGGGAARGGAEEFAAGPHGEGYLRMVVHVDRDGMRVRDASVVDGPLAQPDLAGEMAYEAVVRGRRVGSGAFGDLSRRHGYAPPGADTVAHRVSETDEYEFVVRIPRSDITLDELGELEIGLVRPQTATELAEEVAAMPGAPFADAAVASGREPPRVIARLEGVDLDGLPDSAIEQLRQRLR